MPNLSSLKNEIATVKDIKKITGAMELVATAKLKRVGKKIIKLKEYVSEVYSTVNDIISQVDQSVYLAESTAKFNKTLWIVVNSNLGLCGGYNANINKMVYAKLKPADEVYVIGAKGVSYFSARQVKIVKENLTIDIDFTYEEAKVIGKEILEYFNSKEYDEVNLAYTKFINNVSFEPTILRLFPIIKNTSPEAAQAKNDLHAVLSFEPSPQVALATCINLYLNTIFFGMLTESQVSEQASRRISMEAATKNGDELYNDLRLKYNRIRQAGITSEITEISAGTEAQAQ